MAVPACKVAVPAEDDIRFADDCVLQGRLKNLETLAGLVSRLGHLLDSQRLVIIGY